MRYSHCTRRQLESLIGQLNFAAPYLPLGRLKLLPLITWMNTHTLTTTRDLQVPFLETFKKDLEIWCDIQFLSACVPMSTATPLLQLMTDASKWGWSGVLLPHSVSGQWPKENSDRSSNWLELKAVYLSIVALKQYLSNKDVLLMSDNSTVVACIKRQGTLKAAGLMELTKRILEFCHLHSILLIPKHLSGRFNVLADSGSRQGPISTEWTLDRATFLWLEQRFGPFQVDMFATRENTQLPTFVSPFPDPLAWGVNGLSLRWDNWDSLYLFPPTQIMQEVVNRLQSFQGRGVLVAPYYAQSGWFPSLLLRSPNPLQLPDSHSLSQTTNLGEEYHKNPSVFRLHAWAL